MDYRIQIRQITSSLNTVSTSLARGRMFNSRVADGMRVRVYPSDMIHLDPRGWRNKWTNYNGGWLTVTRPSLSSGAYRLHVSERFVPMPAFPNIAIYRPTYRSRNLRKRDQELTVYYRNLTQNDLDFLGLDLSLRIPRGEVLDLVAAELAHADVKILGRKVEIRAVIHDTDRISMRFGLRGVNASIARVDIDLDGSSSYNFNTLTDIDIEKVKILPGLTIAVTLVGGVALGSATSLVKSVLKKKVKKALVDILDGFKPEGPEPLGTLPSGWQEPTITMTIQERADEIAVRPVLGLLASTNMD